MNLKREHKHLIIARLIARAADGSITPPEEATLREWLKDEGNRKLYERVKQESPLPDSLDEFDPFDVEEGYEKFKISIGKRSNWWRGSWVLAAASIMMLLVLSFTIYHAVRNKPTVLVVAIPDDQNDIAPGGNRAVLVLPDGQSISLDESQEGIIVRSTGVIYPDGRHIVDVVRPDINEVARLVLNTPMGGTYRVAFEDGTQVWLNAGSQLHYPLCFDVEERRVEVVGEAYFEVAHDEAKPFTVISEGQEIRVLGTEFNVSAYADELTSTTTLVNGKVRVLRRFTQDGEGAGLEQIELAPREQAVVHSRGLDKVAVNPELFTAWKSGYFYFEKTPLEDILKQASRWYDIEVVYEGAIPQETFSGEFRRSVSLRGLLDILQHSTIDVSVKGRILYVHQST